MIPTVESRQYALKSTRHEKERPVSALRPVHRLMPSPPMLQSYLAYDRPARRRPHAVPFMLSHQHHRLRSIHPFPRPCSSLIAVILDASDTVTARMKVGNHSAPSCPRKPGSTRASACAVRRCPWYAALRLLVRVLFADACYPHASLVSASKRIVVSVFYAKRQQPPTYCQGIE